MSLALFTLVGCGRPSVSPEDLARLEQRIAALEATREAAGGPADPAVVRGLELRIQDLEQRLAATPAAAGPEALGMATVQTDPNTGALVPFLNEDATVSCAHGMLGGMVTAEQAYNAAFDVYGENLEQIGWAPDPTQGWTFYVAAAVEVEGDRFTAHAVITRGAGRGRHLVMAPDGPARELARLDEAGIATFLAGHAWAGSAR